MSLYGRPSYTALTAWHRELKNGERTNGEHTSADRDPLYYAAYREADAREFADSPLLSSLHDGCIRDARDIIVEAAREQREATA